MKSTKTSLVALASMLAAGMGTMGQAVEIASDKLDKFKDFMGGYKEHEPMRSAKPRFVGWGEDGIPRGFSGAKLSRKAIEGRVGKARLR